VAIDEDVDAVGLSILSGSHKELVAAVMESLKAAGAADIKIFLGGTIPKSDYDELHRLGVKAIFTADQKLDDVVASMSRAFQ
jgi:methylmalonyl-CoA mutase cobalamin-binding domain/chain